MYYLPDLDFETNFKNLQTRFPQIANDIQFDRLIPDTIDSFYHQLDEKAKDFDNDGRGKSYREAQIDFMVRHVGIEKLFDLVAPNNQAKDLTSNHKIIDILGGNGVLAKCFNKLFPNNNLTILTSDISASMIQDALANGLLAFRQPAHKIFTYDNVFDGSIIAYGMHHLDDPIRCCRESWRILKYGGKIVIHDFEIGSNVDKWFREIVDKYSITRHNFRHFTKADFTKFLTEAGFHSVTVDKIFDPFCSKDLASHVQKMYGLKLTKDEVWDLINRYFGTYKLNNEAAVQKYFIMPRFALVGVGTK